MPEHRRKLMSTILVSLVACSGEVAHNTPAMEGGTGDATADAQLDGASDSSNDSGGDQGTPGDEAGSDGPEADVEDGAMTDGSLLDSGAEVGCGPLFTTDNCGACGIACAMGVSVVSAACCAGSMCPGPADGTGNTCQYTCASGFLDCNAMTPPNTDGCECEVVGASSAPCCSGGCPSRHSNGLGQASSTFYDCLPAGTVDSQLAQDACIAYVGAGNASACQLYENPGDGGALNAWCSGPLTGDCICWTFSGEFKGQVLDPRGMGLPNPQNCRSGPSSSTFD